MRRIQRLDPARRKNATEPAMASSLRKIVLLRPRESDTIEIGSEPAKAPKAKTDANAEAVP